MGRPHIIGARESTHASARSTPFSATVRAGIRGGFAGAVLIWSTRRSCGSARST